MSCVLQLQDEFPANLGCYCKVHVNFLRLRQITYMCLGVQLSLLLYAPRLNALAALAPSKSFSSFLGHR